MNDRWRVLGVECSEWWEDERMRLKYERKMLLKRMLEKKLSENLEKRVKCRNESKTE